MFRRVLAGTLAAAVSSSCLLAQQSPAQQPAQTPAAQTPPVTEPARLNPAEMSISALLSGAQQLLELRQYRQAATFLEAVLQRDSKNVEALSMLGDVYFENGDAFTARGYYTEAHKYNSTHFRANLGLGKTYLTDDSSGMARQAVGYLEAAERVCPPERRGEVLALLARAYRGTGDRSTAIETAQRAVREDQDNLMAWSTLVTTRTELNQFDQALVESQTLVDIASRRLQRSPGSQQAATDLSATYETRLWVLQQVQRSLHVPTPAGQYTDEVLPGKEKQAAANLANTIDTVLQQLRLRELLERHRMLALAEQAMKYDPQNPIYAVRLGLMLRSVNQNSRAVQAFKQALTLDPDNAEARRQLAELEAAGFGGEAQEPPREGTGEPTPLPPGEAPGTGPERP